jgi:hypothetical protein
LLLAGSDPLLTRTGITGVYQQEALVFESSLVVSWLLQLTRINFGKSLQRLKA